MNCNSLKRTEEQWSPAAVCPISGLQKPQTDDAVIVHHSDEDEVQTFAYCSFFYEVFFRKSSLRALVELTKQGQPSLLACSGICSEAVTTEDIAPSDL